MARLVMQHGDKRFSTPIVDRVSIGRAPECGLVVDEEGVAPTQAHVCVYNDGHLLVPCAGGAAIQVNGVATTARRPLAHRDAIRIGNALIVFDAESSGPAVANPAGDSATGATSNSAPTAGAADEIVSFECPCGARLQARKSLAGRKGKCKSCGRLVPIPAQSDPSRPGRRSRRGDDGQAIEELCSICQTPIESDDPVTTCRACGLPYHTECWTENLGCAAYGCINVHFLRKREESSAPRSAGPTLYGQATPQAVRPSIAVAPTEEEDFPWEFAILAASVVAAIVSAITFGLPSILISIVAVAYAAATPDPQMPPLYGVWGLSLLATLFGLLVSFMFWFL